MSAHVRFFAHPFFESSTDSMPLSIRAWKEYCLIDDYGGGGGLGVFRRLRGNNFSLFSAAKAVANGWRRSRSPSRPGRPCLRRSMAIKTSRTAERQRVAPLSRRERRCRAAAGTSRICQAGSDGPRTGANRSYACGAPFRRKAAMAANSACVTSWPPSCNSRVTPLPCSSK